LLKRWAAGSIVQFDNPGNMSRLGEEMMAVKARIEGLEKEKGKAWAWVRCY
jgi:hypothetical protein